MSKRGSLDISFGMIFSILIIIAIIGVAIYAIVSFISVGKCAGIGVFQNDFKDSVDKAWASETTKTTFIGSLPSSIEMVCFGNLSLSSSADYQEQYRIFKRYSVVNANTFLYPFNSEHQDDAQSTS